jgi:hypothetical protein
MNVYIRHHDSYIFQRTSRRSFFVFPLFPSVCFCAADHLWHDLFCIVTEEFLSISLGKWQGTTDRRTLIPWSLIRARNLVDWKPLHVFCYFVHPLARMCACFCVHAFKENETLLHWTLCCVVVCVYTYMYMYMYMHIHIYDRYIWYVMCVYIYAYHIYVCCVYVFMCYICIYIYIYIYGTRVCMHDRKPNAVALDVALLCM